MKKNLALLPALLLLQVSFAQTKLPAVVYSPDKNISVGVSAQDAIILNIKYQKEELVNNIRAGLNIIEMPNAFKNPKVKSVSIKSHNEKITPVLPEKRSVIPDVYTQMEVWFKGDYGVKIRVYNDGAAWRLMTKFKRPVSVQSEALSFTMAGEDSVYLSHQEDLLDNFEELFPYYSCREIKQDFLCTLPILFRKASGKLVAFSESDLRDYGGLNLKTSPSNGLIYNGYIMNAVKPAKISEASGNPDSMTRFDYIAAVKGEREFPWRVFGIAARDEQLLENDIVYRLASPCELTDVSWIKPGKSAWEWWNDWNLKGVPFKAGINTETYKYYIDFAAKNGLEYMLFDEGWTAAEDLEKVNPNLDMDELAAYAKEKNVGIILWTAYKTFVKQMERALDKFAAWGCAGIKLDFLNRDDQQMINFIENASKECAKRKLLLDLHGVSKPTGLSRTFPNQLTREGVRGNENNLGSCDIIPSFTTTLPFTRMFAGPMDYTPGGMRNVSVKDFKPNRSAPSVMGTRCAELAKFVIYDCPLPTLVDSPSAYEKEPEAMDFISSVPTVWDHTAGLSARAGKYVIEARSFKNDWYVAGMTDGAKETEVSLSFLPPGNFTLELWEDGMNAAKNATDFSFKKINVDKNSVVKIKMAEGGGFVGRIKKN